MIARDRQILARYEAPDFARLVAIGDAVRLLETDDRTLRRLCESKLVFEGMAVKATPAGGGQEQWFIYRHYDARLCPDLAPLMLESDLSAFTKKQREGAMLRRVCVERFRAGRKNLSGPAAAVAAAILAQCRKDFPGLRVSRSRLYEWDRRYRNPCDLARLIDTRGGNQQAPQSPEAWAAFKDLYLHQNRPSVRQCWRAVQRMAAENDWDWCSYDSCQRQLDERVPPQEASRHRDPACYRQAFAPYIEQDADAWRAGELWIGDHKQLDLICWWGKQQKIRPWLTTWMDWRTRRVAGWVLSESPNSTTILGALRHGLMDAKNKGGPRGVWIDNGKDYDAWLFHGQTKQQRRETIKPRVEEAGTLGIFAALKIDAHFATPYNPNGKARLERWFRTLETFARTFETYTGDGIDTKPERLSEILEKPRSIPTFADVQKRMADHIAGNNLRTDHDVDDLIDAGERLSPDEAMSRWNDRTRVWADPKALDVLLMHWHQPVTVGRNGIKIGLGGLRMGYGSTSPELARFKAAKRSQRKPVLVAFDPHDLRTIRVFDEQFRYVCTAPMNRLGGMHGDKIDRELVADLNRDKARYERSQKHVAEYSITSVLTNEENLAHMAAKRGAERDRQRAAATPTAPASMQMVQTPLDGQAVEIEREEMRAAVGAESPASRRRVNPLDLLNMIRARDEAARNQPAKDRGHHADDADAAAPAAAPNHDDADDADDDATASVGVGVAADSYARLRRTYGRD